MPMRARLKSLIPASDALSLARSTLFVQRQRKLDLSAFLWTLVLGFGSGGPRCYSGLFEMYLGAAKRKLSESAFFEWLGKSAFPVWARSLVDHVMEQLASEVGPKFSGVLAQFRELFVTDASVLRIARRLAKRYPAANSVKAPAALKVHVIQRGGGSNLHRVNLTEGKRADSRVLKMGPWVHNALLLMDLGYYAFRRFARIMKLGGYFVSRVKSDANPIITRVLRTHRGRAIKVEGERLQDVLTRLQRGVLDVEVEVQYSAGLYDGHRGRHRLRLRLVGLWFPFEKRYRLFFTNLTPEQASAQEVADLYRLRWQVELFFKELKSVYKLGDLPGERPETIEAMVFISILSALVTRALLRELRTRHHLAEAALTDGQAAKIIQRHALALLDLLVIPKIMAIPMERRLDRTLKTTLKRRSKGRPSLVTELYDLRGSPDIRRRAA